MAFEGIPAGSKVAVAMSGGVDSSVTALLLREAGFEVLGVTMALWSCHKSDRARKQTCCSTLDVEDARQVCARLDIPHVVADFRTEFRTQVIDNFVSEYAHGRTPIPCVGCNQYFKFDRLWAMMRNEHGCDYIATGHYAQIARNGAGEVEAMRRGRDPKKDQSYYLFVMTREQLQHSLFPLGHLTKPEVRELAKKYGLATAEKPESFEICFVPDNDYAGFIEDYYPDATAGAGDFIDQAGAVIGRHQGTHAFTIGQRRGLGDSFGERKYVTAIDAAQRRVTLGGAQDLLETTLHAAQFNWIRPAPSVGASIRGEAKIRAQHVPAACAVTAVEGGQVDITFDAPQSAITPGQAVVVYDGDDVVGGGWIA